MKHRLLLLVLFCSAYSGWAQMAMNCCAKDANASFAQLGADKAFVMSHQDPIPFTFVSDNGKSVSFKAPDGSDAFAYEVKAKNPSPYYLFVVHEWWGLNDYIKKQSEQFATDLGVNVLAIDLYDKRVASTADEAGKIMQAIKPERAEAIIKGALAYVGKDAKILTIGWCFGGGWSLQSSILAGPQAAGCVVFYGMPEKNIDKLKSLNADVLGIFGNKDQWINPTVVNDFASDMKKAGKKLEVYRYDADHAFANPSNPIYDKPATEDAYKHVYDFLKARIKT